MAAGCRSVLVGGRPAPCPFGIEQDTTVGENRRHEALGDDVKGIARRFVFSRVSRAPQIVGRMRGSVRTSSTS